jgi:hypothetical protein
LIDLAVALSLLALSGGFLWLGAVNPTFDFRKNQGFPANWSCLSLGQGSAQVCGRDAKSVSQDGVGRH